MRRVIEADLPVIDKWYLSRGMLPPEKHLYP